MIEIKRGAGKFELSARAVSMGEGWSVTITGGDRPHLGAVALGIPRPSLKNPEEISSSVSVLTITGHKEDELTRPAAAKLCSGLNLPVVVSAGIHADFIKNDDILRFNELADDILCELLEKMRRFQGPAF